MSCTETKIGKLYKVNKRFEKEELEKVCKRCLRVDIGCNVDKMHGYYKTYEEWLISEHCEDYIVYKNELYYVSIAEEYNNECDILKAYKNEDNSIGFVLSYYNGGCCFTEAIEASLKKMEVDNNDK